MNRDRTFVSFDLFATLVDLHDVEDESAFERFAHEMDAEGISAPPEWWIERKRELTEEAFDRARLSRADGGDIDVFDIFVAMVTEASKGLLSDSHAAARMAASRFRRCATLTLEPVHQVVAALPELRRDFTLLVISNTQRCYSEEEMDRFGLRRWFDAVVFSSDVGLCKPHPELFERGLAAVGARPDQWLHVGDNPADDVVGAEQIGGSALWIERPDRNAVAPSVASATGRRPDSVVTVTARPDDRATTDEIVHTVRRWCAR